jgi:hypothetical protein
MSQAIRPSRTSCLYVQASSPVLDILADSVPVTTKLIVSS